jgi:hypothetical protein
MKNGVGFLSFYKVKHKILLGYFNAKVGRKDIFKPTTGNESQHQISNNNDVRTVKFALSKNLFRKSTTFPHRKIQNYTSISSDGKSRNRRITY